MGNLPGSHQSWVPKKNNRCCCRRAVATGVFLAPQPPNPRLWTSTCSDRFMPHDAPVKALEIETPRGILSEGGAV